MSIDNYNLKQLYDEKPAEVLTVEKHPVFLLMLVLVLCSCVYPHVLMH